MRTTALLLFTFFLTDKYFCQDIFPFRQGDKWFYVDKSFKPISSKRYLFIYPFIGSRAVVRQNNKYGVIDDKEKTIIPFEYDTISYFYPYFDCVKNKNLYQIDLNGKIIPTITGACGGVTSSSRSCFTYTKGNKIGLLDFYKNSTKPDSLPNKYDEFIEFNDGIAAVKIGKKWGIINCLGKVITDFILDSVVVTEYTNRDRDKLCKYFINGQMGFLNGLGKIVTTTKFKDLVFNYNEFSLVKINDNRLVYIDNKGREYYK